jgi:hypothetical protein
MNRALSGEIGDSGLASVKRQATAGQTRLRGFVHKGLKRLYEDDSMICDVVLMAKLFCCFRDSVRWLVARAFLSKV